MERRIVTIPPALMRVTGVNWGIDWREQGTGASLAGTSNVLIGRLPRWVGDLPLHIPPPLVGQWNAHVAHGRGRLAVFHLRMIDPAVNAHQVGAALPFAGGATFAGGVGWANWPIAPCPSGAAAGAEEIVLDETGISPAIAVGQILSHDGRPFRVTWRMDEGGGLVRLGIEMPLRAAIAANDPVELVGEGYFEPVEPARAADYDLSRSASPVLRLQEWLGR